MVSLALLLKYFLRFILREVIWNYIACFSKVRVGRRDASRCTIAIWFWGNSASIAKNSGSGGGGGGDGRGDGRRDGTVVAALAYGAVACLVVTSTLVPVSLTEATKLLLVADSCRCPCSSTILSRGAFRVDKPLSYVHSHKEIQFLILKAS